ncbi:MAG TPA: nucleotidyltransferase domain-containing protein [Spirochaetota bacterium]|nr:nucleotidyltransferase domain-containing protein [Spirochaetota bacterium]
MINPEIASKLDIIRDILTKNNVKKAYLFGSVLRDDFKKDSDIDIYVDFDKNLDLDSYSDCWWNVLFSLEDYLQRPVDLLTKNNLSNPYFIDELNKTRIEIL